MAKEASKKKSTKTVKKEEKPGSSYEFIIRDEDVLEREHFGSFEVIKTSRGIMFKNYTGYHVYTTPYAVGIDGVAHKNSLYSWLENLLEAKKEYRDHMDEQFENELKSDGTPLLNRDIYDYDVIITIANLIKPLTAFVDVDEATMAAVSYMDWLNKKQEELLEATSKELSPEAEDAKIEAEEIANLERQETIQEMAGEALEKL